MEDLVVQNFNIYKNKKIMITGHTGFKGSWLALWLNEIGADVAGYSLPADSLSHFKLLNLPVKNYFHDINDEQELNKAFKDFRPDIVFHMAAQPLVRHSYDNPIQTYETNVLGSLKVYWAALKSGTQALVSITTDKVYENKEWDKGYSENDRLGGFDPYSSSKACVELMSSSFINSFLRDGKMLLSTVRAGNVIGGGDWAEDRLFPDLMKNAFSKKITKIRNPSSIRPWQHVLEPLNGYLMVGEKLLENNKAFATSFNFGPHSSGELTVREVCEIAKENWQAVNYEFEQSLDDKHEARLLKLDISKSIKVLGWQPIMSPAETISTVVSWYKNYYEFNKSDSLNELRRFLNKIK